MGSQSTSFSSHQETPPPPLPTVGSAVLDRYRAKFDEPASAAALSYASSYSSGQRLTTAHRSNNGPSVRFALGQNSTPADPAVSQTPSTPIRGSTLVAMPRSPFEFTPTHSRLNQSMPTVSPVEGQPADQSGMGGIFGTAAAQDALDVRSQSSFNSFSMSSNLIGVQPPPPPPTPIDPDAEVAKVWLQRDTTKLSAFAILKARLKEREEAALEAKRRAAQLSVLGGEGLGTPMQQSVSRDPSQESPARQGRAGATVALDGMPESHAEVKTQPRAELSHQLDLLISDLLIPEHLAAPRSGSYSPPRGQRSFRYVMEHSSGHGKDGDDVTELDDLRQSSSVPPSAIPESIRGLVRAFADYAGAATDRAVARTAGSLYHLLQESRLPFGSRESRSHNAGGATSPAVGLYSSFSEGGLSSGTELNSTEDEDFGARSRSDSILLGSEAKVDGEHRSFRTKAKNRFAMQQFNRYLRRVEETVTYEFLALACNYMQHDGTATSAEDGPSTHASPLRSKDESSLPFTGVPAEESPPANQDVKQHRIKKKRLKTGGTNAESLPCLVPETALNYYHRFSLSFSLSEYLSKWSTAEKIRFRLGIMLYRLECFRAWFLAETMLDYVLGPKIGGRFGFSSVGVGSLTDLHDLLTTVHGKFGDYSLRSFHPLVRKALLAVGACCKHHDEKLTHLRALSSRTKQHVERANAAQSEMGESVERQPSSLTGLTESPLMVQDSAPTSDTNGQGVPTLSILKELQEQYCQRLCIACASNPWLPILSDYRSSSTFKHQLSDLPEADLHRHLALVQGKNPSVVGLWRRSRTVIPNGEKPKSSPAPPPGTQNGDQNEERDWIQLAFGTTRDNRVAFTLAAENNCIANLLRFHQELLKAQDALRPLRRTKVSDTQVLSPDMLFRAELALEIAADASELMLPTEEARDQVHEYFLKTLRTSKQDELVQERGRSSHSSSALNCHPETFWLHTLTEVVPSMHNRNRERLAGSSGPGTPAPSRDPMARLAIQQGVEVWKQANRCTLSLALFEPSFWSDSLGDPTHRGREGSGSMSPPRGETSNVTTSSVSPVRLERTKIPESLLGLKEKEDRTRFFEESTRHSANASIGVHALACLTAQMIREGLVQSEERHATPLHLHGGFISRASSATDIPYSDLWPPNILFPEESHGLSSNPCAGDLALGSEDVSRIISFIFGIPFNPERFAAGDISAAIVRGELTGDDLLRAVSRWEQSSVSFVRFVQAVAPLTTVEGRTLAVGLTKRSLASTSSRATSNSRASDSDRSSPTDRALSRLSDAQKVKQSPDGKGGRGGAGEREKLLPAAPSGHHHREGRRNHHRDLSLEDADEDEETLILLKGRSLLLKYGIRRADSPRQGDG